MATVKKAQKGIKVAAKEAVPGPYSDERVKALDKASIFGKGKMKPTTPKAKDGKSFPDLNKDGKITKADILKGRGVIAKKGAKVMPCASCGKSMKKK